MTTTTTDRARLEELLGEYWEIAFDESSGVAATGNKANRVLHEIRALFDALAAPATAPEKTVKEIMEFARHYAADTFSSATLEDKIRRSLAAPATAPAQPAWHDAPTCAGLWHVKTHPRSHPTVIAEVFVSDVNAVPTHCRWYGPIPEDRQ